MWGKLRRDGALDLPRVDLEALVATGALQAATFAFPGLRSLALADSPLFIDDFGERTREGEIRREAVSRRQGWLAAGRRTDGLGLPEGSRAAVGSRRQARVGVVAGVVLR